MEFVVKLDKDDGASGRGLYIYTSKGEFDVAGISICRLNDGKSAFRQKRPAANMVHLLKRYRFPAGLPSGWTVVSEQGAVCLDDSVLADDGVATLAVTGGASTIYSEPFQTNEAEAEHTASFYYRTEEKGKLRVSIIRDNRREIASLVLEPSVTWRKGSIGFKAPGDVAAFTLCFKAEGAFAIDRTDVTVADKACGRGDEPTVTLYMKDGEIARHTRVQFAHEPATLHGIATDVPDGAQVILRVCDLYGRNASLGKIRFPKGGKIKTFKFSYDAFKDCPLGQFRVSARLVKGAEKLSRVEEFIATRVQKPVAWRRDAPLSPFGSHFLPLPERLDMMKACGVNWMRLHDAGTRLSGWWALEKEKGRWQWPDEDIARIRRSGINIYAQLGTAPAWATHYNDLGCKRMGYFEKYLRPVDMAAWTNYVSKYVSRYAGKINDYFIWNEPWGEWWALGKDIRYYNKDRAAEDYGAFSRITYDVAKRVNPSAEISSMNASWGEPGSNWTERVCAGGGYEGCDAMDFHLYARAKLLLRGEASYSGKTFSPIFAAHPLDNKPVIMSEGQGAAYALGGDGGVLRMGGLYSVTVPWEPATSEELSRFSDRTCRYVLSLLTEKNLKRVFLYTTQGFFSLGQRPSYQTLLSADGYPHPSFAAFSQMASAIEGKKFVRRLDYGRLNGVRVDFTGKSARCSVYANLTKDEACSLAACTELVDLYGNRFSPDRFFTGTLLYEIRCDVNTTEGGGL
jgi:hypothetical protein